MKNYHNGKIMNNNSTIVNNGNNPSSHSIESGFFSSSLLRTNVYNTRNNTNI